MDKRRPVRVIACGVIAIIMGLIKLYGELPLDMRLIVASYSKGLSLNLPKIISNHLISISYLVAGIFVIKLHKWARILLILQMIYWIYFGYRVFIAFNIFAYAGMIGIKFGSLSFLYSGLMYSLVFILPGIMVILYLLRPKVKEQFR